jgi:hypothetical protein
VRWLPDCRSSERICEQFSTRPKGRVFVCPVDRKAVPDAAPQHPLSTAIPQSFHDFTDLTSISFWLSKTVPPGTFDRTKFLHIFHHLSGQSNSAE